MGSSTPPRRTDITEQDLRSFPLGGESSPFVFDGQPPPITAQPSGPRPSEPPAPRVEPIRPPQGTPNVNPPS